MTAPARPALSTGLLVPGDRVARPPVPVWAARLRERVAALRAGERRSWPFAEGVGRVANNTALIAAFQGAPDRAESLCRAQIRWQYRTSRRSRDPGIAKLGVQPWVNLGRLQAMTGDWQGALERFARIAHPGADGWLCLGAVRVPPAEGAGEAGGFGEFLRNTYVADSLKALLMNGRHAEVLAFAARNAADEGNAPVVHEARVVATARLGELEEAAALAREGRRRWPGWVRAVFSLRLAEVLACAGEREQARQGMERMASAFAALSPASWERLERLYILVRAAQLCGECGLAAEAGALARTADGGAEAAEDEILRMEALRVRCAAAPEDDEARLALGALQAGTGYARYRAGSRPPLRDAEADALFGELDELFAG